MRDSEDRVERDVFKEQTINDRQKQKSFILKCIDFKIPERYSGGRV